MHRTRNRSQLLVPDINLRRRAEIRLKKELSIRDASQLQDVGLQLYEQRIDQIETQLLSEEFNRLREQASANGIGAYLQETPANGYFFLDRDGRICDAKFSPSSPDKTNDRKWQRHFLSDYVALDATAFYEYLEDVFESNSIKSCELSFKQASSTKHLGLKLPLYAAVHAVADDDKKYCLVVAVDISTRKIAERKKAQAVLRRHKQVIGAAMDGFWITDEQGVLEEVNEAYARMSGYSVQELVGMNISQLEVSEGSVEVNAHIHKLMQQGSDRFETQHRRKDGSVIDIEVSSTFLPESKEIFVFSHDITQRKQAEQALRIAAATFETQDAILITDAQANIIRVNRAFTEITGYDAEDVIGKNPRILSSGREDKVFYFEMWKHLLEQGCWAGEIWDRRKNGEIYPKWMTLTAVKNEHGETTQYVAIFSDITMRKQMDEQIRQLAFYDTLTKLPNRRLLNERLSQTMMASKRSGCYGAVMFLDLDNFKPLNDMHGHVIGDLLLIEAADRLKGCVREIDTVARFGGDEFMVMISELYADKAESTAQAEIVAEKIRSVLSAPYYLNISPEGEPELSVEHRCTVSIGVVVFINHQGSQEDILKWADEAMYQAKDAGRNLIRFYDWKD
jgi:diguanylate cyclase (GGDEF)-like protein/PAS domain S-box-containing protein